MEELNENRECIRKIDEMLEPYSEQIAADQSSLRNELIRFFQLDSDDPKVLEESLKQMWARVGGLQNAITNLNAAGRGSETINYCIEIAIIRDLRLETMDRIKVLNSGN